MDVEKLTDRLKNYSIKDKALLNLQTVKDAAEALTTLQAELEKVKAERDAAVECIPHECKTCVYHTVFFNGCTPDHDCTNHDGGCSNNYDRWEWHGPQKEE